MDSLENNNLEIPPETPGGQIDYSKLNPPEKMGGGRNMASSPNRQYVAASPNQTNPNQTDSKPVNPLQPQPLQPSSPTANYQPPKGGKGPLFIMTGLVLLIILAVLIFMSWKGWISLGGIGKLWGGDKTTPSPTVTVSSEPSAEFSPTIETSSKISPNISPEVSSNANDEIRKGDLKRIQEALKKYFQANSKYPESAEITKTSDTSSSLAQVLIPTYLSSLPDDPLAPQYYYGYKSDGQSFELTGVLEDTTDPSGSYLGQYYIYKLTNSEGG